MAAPGQHKAEVRRHLRQAAGSNSFALESLADELKDAKDCLVRATRPHVKALLAAQIRYAAAEELRLLSDDGAPAHVSNARMTWSQDVAGLAADLKDAKALLGKAKRAETKGRLAAFVRAATAAETDVLAAQGAPPPNDEARVVHDARRRKAEAVHAPAKTRRALVDEAESELARSQDARVTAMTAQAGEWTAKKLAEKRDAEGAPATRASPPRSRAFDGCRKGFLGGAAPTKAPAAATPRSGPIPPPLPPATKKKTGSLSDFARKLPPPADPEMHHRRAAAYERHREREAAEKATREAEAPATAREARLASLGAADAAAVLSRAAATASAAAAKKPAASPARVIDKTGNDPAVDALAARLRTMGNSKARAPPSDEEPNCPPPRPLHEQASSAPRPLKPRPRSAAKSSFVAVSKFGWEQGNKTSPWARVNVPLAGVTSEQVTCEFGDDAFDLQIRGEHGKDYRLRRNALGGAIDPRKSSHAVSGGRVVVKLRKKPLDDGTYVEWEELSCPGGDREKANDNAPRKPDGEPYDIARKLYETGDPFMRAKLGAAATRRRDQMYKDGTEDPLADILKKHGASSLDDVLKRQKPDLAGKMFDSGLGR